MKIDSKQSGNTIISFLLFAIVVVIIGLVAWHIHSYYKNPAVSNSTSTNSNTNSSAASNTTPLPSGNNNSTLETDLSSVNQSINIENQNSSTTGNAINDQQNEITVPTN